MRKQMILLAMLILALPMFLSACGTPETVVETVVVPQQVTVEVPVEVTVPVEVEVTRQVEVLATAETAPLGSEENPIKVLFVPSVDAEVIVAGGEMLAQALEEATGLKFEVSVPTSYAATIESICASPNDTMAFIPALGYVLAHERCGVQVGNAVVRFGLSWYAAQIVVRMDSGIETLEDLDGKKWAQPSATSTSGALFPMAMFQAAGIEPGETIEAGGHSNAMLAVYNGEVDFATAFFSPPLLPEGRWTPGVHDPEVWREAGVSPVRNAEGRTLVAGGPAEGGYRILDARSGVSDTAPDIFDVTRILAITDPIPNDTVSFGSGFPVGLAQEIIAALSAYATSPACLETLMSICSEDFYNITGLEPVTDSFYDPVRFLIEQLGYTEEDILK